MCSFSAHSIPALTLSSCAVAPCGGLHAGSATGIASLTANIDVIARALAGFIFGVSGALRFPPPLLPLSGAVSCVDFPPPRHFLCFVCGRIAV
jgi:hypothetical protein